jgi:hypothetical protein
MQKISKSKFQTKCNELGINANQSIFFKTGFFQKFGCSPFCHLDTIQISERTAPKLKINFIRLCQKYLHNLQKSNNVLIHFKIHEDFPFIFVQEMMDTLQKSIQEETNVVMDMSYISNEVDEISIVLFLEE